MLLCVLEYGLLLCYMLCYYVGELIKEINVIIYNL